MTVTKFAFVFPGQGSQKVGMLADLASEFEQIESTFQQASGVLGYDLWALAQNGPQDQLNLTEITQPLLLTSSVAIWRVWGELGGAQPDFMAGHSLGEYSALVCAQVIDFEKAVFLVQQRGKFMQQSVPVGEGAMSAVLGLDDSVVIDVCNEMTSAQNVVEAVNFNSPGQVVIAGHADAVNRAGERLKNEGARRVAPLPVSAPFHTSLMAPAGDALAEIMSDMQFRSPAIPVIHNVNARSESDGDAIRGLMIEQTSSAVRWTDSIQYMVDQNVELTVECGPGKVLSGMSRKIHKSLQVASLEQPGELRAAMEMV